MTLPRLWACLAVGLPVIAALIGTLSTVDLAYHVRAGEITLRTGQIPSRDVFTYTVSGADWLNQQWAAQVVLAAVHRLAGWGGLVILRAVLIGLTFALLFEACRRRGLDLRRAAWLTLGAFVVSAAALALRPQLFGMALMALTLLIVADRRAHPDRMWAIPLIVLVWANMHGSFFLGVVILGLAWVEDAHENVPNHLRVLWLTVASAAAALVNPWTVSVWPYAVGLSSNSLVTGRITEWQATTLRSVPGLLFFASAGLVVALVARRGRVSSWPTLLWFAVFAGIGLYAVRGVAWWPLAAAVTVASMLAATSAPVLGRERSSPLNLVLIGSVAAACIALLPVWRPIDERLAAPVGVLTDAPPGITSALRGMLQPGDRILNPQPWGSWFEFALPTATIAVDSRVELLPSRVWDEIDAIRRGTDGWQALLAAQAPTVVVTESSETAFVRRLEAVGWTARYSDEDGTILAPPS